MPINYHDFVIIADDVTTDQAGAADSFAISVFDSPVGQGSKKEKVTVPPDISQRLRWLENRRLDSEPSKQIELGEIIGSLLLPDYARRMFSESLNRLRPAEGLRLRLRLAGPLVDVPWEYAYLPDATGVRDAAGFLSLDPRISIVRHEALEIPADWFDPPGDWFERPVRRRVLVAMASPLPHSVYRKLEQLPNEQKSIRNALNNVKGVEASFIPLYDGADADGSGGATVGSLAAGLMQQTDVFHFSGHGEFPKSLAGRDAALIFADDQNQAFPVSSEKLAGMLRGKGVRLAVLGACETGRREGRNVWSGVASSLLRAGIPAVVAMQFTIDDKLAAAFSAAFYRSLTAGLTVDEAVAAGRSAIRMEATGSNSDIRDWGVPVLYLRAAGGRVFNPIADETAVQKAIETNAHLFEQQIKRITQTGRVFGPVIDSVESESVTVHQKVTEETQGLLVGPTIFKMEGGRLSVKHELGDVSGTVVGARIGTLGGRSKPNTGGSGAPDAVAELEKLLRLVE